jgi:hypothetical protein
MRNRYRHLFPKQQQAGEVVTVSGTPEALILGHSKGHQNGSQEETNTGAGSPRPATRAPIRNTEIQLDGHFIDSGLMNRLLQGQSLGRESFQAHSPLRVLAHRSECFAFLHTP